MKLSHYLLAGWALIACLSSCKKPIDPVDPIVTPIPGPNPENPVIDPSGLVFPIGEPIGVSDLNVTVGPAGGAVESEDGRVRLVIPAGALSSEENIRIAPITNTNPTGKGTAYRLEPHGTLFAKPVKLTFTYDEVDLQATVAEALQIAYQADNGVWMAMPGIKLDKQARTITIETTHFSDWTYFSSVFLSPQQRGIRPGESVSMKVYTTLVIPEFLVPLVKPEPVVQLHADQTVPVIQWAISERIGSLATTGAGLTNTYTAPTGIVRPTPVTVTAQVKASGNQFLLLLSSMMIMPEGIVYRLDGGPWIYRVGAAQRYGGQVVAIGAAKPSSGDTGLALNISIPQLNGNQNINLGWGLSASFVASPVQGYLTYQGFYGIRPTFSPGGLYISDIRYSAENLNVETVTVSGGFTVEKAGAYDTPGYIGAHRIEGFFCIGKVN